MARVPPTLKSEKNYGQIEKEMLAIAWGCEKFHDYIYGRSDITVETDHKSLEALYKKPIGSAPPRIQRMMLRIQKYSFRVVWRKGKDLIIADTLSRGKRSRLRNRITLRSTKYTPFVTYRSATFVSQNFAKRRAKT